MSPEISSTIHHILVSVGEWASDEKLAKGALVIGGAILATMISTWRLIRAKPSRARVSLDIPPGEKVKLEIGDHSTEDE